jgi:hypothetical protein
MRRYSGRLLDGFGSGDVDDLDHRNSGQGIFQVAMRAGREMVADLDGIVRQKRWCSMISATLCLDVSRNVPMAGGTVAAISAIRSSLTTPGPLGMCETRPSADAPHSMASAASSTLPMQQIFTRGVSVAFIGGLFCF